MAVITVARQLGSFGDKIAEKTAEALGYDYIDGRLVDEIASITDSSTKEVEKYDEKGEGRVRYFLKRLLVPEMTPGGFPFSSAAYFPEFGLEFPYVIERDVRETATCLDRGTYQLLITTLVQELGEAGDAVIVGRASQVILGNNPGALHIKVIAPYQERCERLMRARDVDGDTAKHLVQQHDRWRQLYLENHFGADWNDLLLYHLILNTGKITVDEAVEIVVGHMRRRG